jgi:hypothetical protein
MAVTLESFVQQELERVKSFKVWYEGQNKINPEHYPLTIPEDNAGVWDEMLADFAGDSK